MSSSPESNPPTDLDRDTVDAIARRVAELLGSVGPGSRYLDTTSVAEMLGVSDEWVRDHAAELGAIRLGDGKRGQLRFEVDRVRTALDRRRLQTEPRPRSARRARRRVAGVQLLPLPASGRSR